MKSKIRIGVAITFGVFVILGAFYMSNTRMQAGTSETGAVLVQSTPMRESVRTADTNNNGIPDWEDELQDKVFASITAPSSSSPYNFNTATYTPPTTLTGKFSEAFLHDYLQGKMNGEDFSDPSIFVNKALQSIDTHTQSKKHIRTELSIIPASAENIRAYGNELARIMQERDSEKNDVEVTVFHDAMTANDPSMLLKLDPIRISYEYFIADALVMNVPDALVTAHISLLNALESIHLDIVAMQSVFTDPLFSLARIKSYESDTRALLNAFKAITELFKSKNVFYADTEPGTLFYIFDSV